MCGDVWRRLCGNVWRCVEEAVGDVETYLVS